MRYTVLICVLLGIVGLGIGLAVSVSAAAMCGFGHGWCSATHSAISVLCAPVAGAIWEMRTRRWSLAVSISLVMIAIYSDIRIAVDTKIEGFEYVRKVLEESPGLFMLWVILFASWQVWAALSVQCGLGRLNAA